MPRFGREQADFFFDDLLGSRQSALAGFPVSLSGFFKVVDRLEVNAQLVADFGLKITRHREI